MNRLFKPSVALPIIYSLNVIIAVSLIAALANAQYAFSVFVTSVIIQITYLAIGVFFFSER